MICIVYFVSRVYGFFLQVADPELYDKNVYAGLKNKELRLVENQGDAIDINMMESIGKSQLFSVLSLGISALSFINGEISIQKLDTEDSKQAFVLILTRYDNYIIKHNDKCLGRGEDNKIVGMECNNSKVLKFNRVNGLSKVIPSTQRSRFIVRHNSDTNNNTGFLGNNYH